MRIIAFHLIGILFLTSCMQRQVKRKAGELNFYTNTVTQVSAQSDSESIDSLRIINSGPRGGNYLSSTGTNYRYGVFRVQIISDAIKPVKLEVKFPRNSISLLPDSTVELKVFILPPEYTPNTIKDTFNFGVKLEEFFESGDSQNFEFVSLIEPKKQSTFFIGVIFESETANGITRSQLTVKGYDESPYFPTESTVHYSLHNEPLNLIYGISFDPPNNYLSIPCGQIRLD